MDRSQEFRLPEPDGFENLFGFFHDQSAVVCFSDKIPIGEVEEIIHFIQQHIIFGIFQIFRSEFCR